MKTSQEIRIENLLALVEEAGTAAALKRATGVPAPYISQLTTGAVNKSGKPRTMGDDTARQLERGMKKPKGWIDADHSASSDALESELLAMFRSLSSVDLKKTVLHSVRGIVHGQAAVSEGIPSEEGLSKLQQMGQSLPVHINKPGVPTNARKKEK